MNRGNISGGTGLNLEIPFLTKRGVIENAKLYSRHGQYLGTIKSICYNEYYAGHIMIELDTGKHTSIHTKFLTQKELKYRLHIRLLGYLHRNTFHKLDKWFKGENKKMKVKYGFEHLIKYDNDNNEPINN